MLAEFRRAGLEVSKLEQVAVELRKSRKQRSATGDVLVVNGTVELARYDELAEVVSRTSPTLVYDLAHAAAGLSDRLEAMV